MAGGGAFQGHALGLVVLQGLAHLGQITPAHGAATAADIKGIFRDAGGELHLRFFVGGD